MPELSSEVMHNVFKASLVGPVKIAFVDILSAKRGRKRLFDFRRGLKEGSQKKDYYGVQISRSATTVVVKRKIQDPVYAAMQKALRRER